MRTMCSRKQVRKYEYGERDAYNINHSNCIHKNNNNKCIHDRNEIVDICDLRAHEANATQHKHRAMNIKY